MRTLVLLFAFAVLGACETTVPVTQIMLRVQTVNELTERDDVTLRIETSVERGGKWSKRTRKDVEPSEIAGWPVDVPLEAHDSVDEGEAVEIIVSALDGTGETLAEVRAVTSFVRRKKKLLEVELWPCPEANVCPSADGCHGTTCQTCLDRVCQDVRETRGSKLPDFVPGAAIEQSDASISAEDAEIDLDAAEEEADTGDVVDMDATDAREADVVETERMDAMSEASMVPDVVSDRLDLIDDDASDATVAPDADAAPECTPAEGTRCLKGGRDIEVCSSGRWKTETFCPQACVAGRCVDCSPNDKRCDPASVHKPQICNEDGYWRAPTGVVPGGECKGVCQAGLCKGECRTEGEHRCVSPSNTRQRCSSNEWIDDLLCKNLCRAGDCITPRSCAVPLVCSANTSCCNVKAIPGGEFKRSYDGVSNTDDGFPATVGDFELDRFEVTVARFRQWVDAFPGSIPAPGNGRNPSNSKDMGWQAEWAKELGTDRTKLIASLGCDPLATWVSGSPVNDTKPINCVTWYMAQAFCIWDGGRLPTEAEWNYAAAAGAQQRVYPWSDPPMFDELDPSRAVLGNESIAEVGSKPAGNGFWGHSDLAGNVAEWVQDEFTDSYTPDCNNCAEMHVGVCKSYRGGSSGSGAFAATSSFRDCLPPSLGHRKVGFRCVKN